MSAIIGLPPGFTHAPPMTSFWSEDRDREAFYTSLLADPRMQPQLGPDGTLASVCESEHARATPAPRIVEAVARARAKWRTPIESAKATGPARSRRCSKCTSSHADAICALAPPRASNGLTACQMLWTLPLPEHAARGTPTRCDDLPFLAPYTERPPDELGHPVCEVHQLRVEGQGADRRLEPGGGWFYDDFSDHRSECLCPFGALDAARWSSRRTRSRPEWGCASTASSRTTRCPPTARSPRPSSSPTSSTHASRTIRAHARGG